MGMSGRSLGSAIASCRAGAGDGAVDRGNSRRVCSPKATTTGRPAERATATADGSDS